MFFSFAFRFVFEYGWHSGIQPNLDNLQWDGGELDHEPVNVEGIEDVLVLSVYGVAGGYGLEV